MHYDVSSLCMSTTTDGNFNRKRIAKTRLNTLNLYPRIGKFDERLAHIDFLEG